VIDDITLSLAWLLHEERNERDVRKRGRRRIALRLAQSEGDAVVGSDDDERAFIHVRLA
jgi:hypothetical protein